MCFQGTCQTAVIQTWVEKCLLPVLKQGDCVIWDNATFHQSNAIRQLIENAGCTLLFLPPYSPDLNPIEKFWALLKSTIRTFLESGLSLSNAIDSAFQVYAS